MLNYNFYKNTKFEYLNNLPEPRVLVGTNTNKKFSDISSFDPLYKSKINL